MTGRIRTVKPEWLEDELLASASDEARVLSVALILMADDYGNGRAALASIASGTWRFQMEENGGEKAPEVLAKASRGLRELVAIRFVELYDIGKQRYFAIRNWKRHQRVDKPGKPHVPGPEDGEIVGFANDSGESRESLANHSGAIPESLAPDLRPTTSTNERERDARAPKASTKGMDRMLGSFGPKPTSALHDIADWFSVQKHAAGFGHWTWDGKNHGSDFDRLTKIDRALAKEEHRTEAFAAAMRGFIADPKAKAESYPIGYLAQSFGAYVAAGQRAGSTEKQSKLEALIAEYNAVYAQMEAAQNRGARDEVSVLKRKCNEIAQECKAIKGAA